MVNLIKFIHLLVALSLVGSVIYSLIALVPTQSIPPDRSLKIILRLNTLMLVLGLLALLSGTLLVLPKHYTFHTHWIEAAYLLLLSFGLSVFLLMLFKRKRAARLPVLSIKERLAWQTAYFALAIVLIVIIHDAVTKSTFLF